VPREYKGGPVTFRNLTREDAPRLFALGQAAGVSGPAWRLTPPGAEPGEESVPRGAAICEEGR
jgi:hypothetical protein